MSIIVPCTGCPTRLSAPESAVGKQIRCPKCKTIITVSVQTAAEEEPVMDAKVVTSASKPAATDEGDDETPRKKTSRRDEVDDEDERPRRKKRPAFRDHQRTGGAGIVLTVFAVAVVGVVLIGAVVAGAALLFHKEAPLESVTGPGGVFPPGGDFMPMMPESRTPPPREWEQHDYPASGMRAYFPREPMTFRTTYEPGDPPGIKVPPLENAYTYNTRSLNPRIPNPGGIVVVIEVARYQESIGSPMRNLVLGPNYRDRGPGGRKLRWLGGEAVETVKGHAIMRTAVLDRVIVDATIIYLDGPVPPQVAAGFFDNVELTR